jgi:2-polyprenyl-6-methoxyphenol hydroxylase-like FAD-dependent oxidoreductase
MMPSGRSSIPAWPPTGILICGPIIDTPILELHGYVIEPMRAGRLFMAGDAAHSVTPVGGKA